MSRRTLVGISVLLIACAVVLYSARDVVELLTHFNPLNGFYTYDPRSEQPSNFFLANHPDIVIVNRLNKQIEQYDTYPPNYNAKVVRVEPVKVAISTYTDWQGYAYVTTRFDYADETSKFEEFRFHSHASKGMWLPVMGGITYHAYYPD